MPPLYLLLPEVVQSSHTENMRCDGSRFICLWSKRILRVGLASGGKTRFTRRNSMDSASTAVFDITAYFAQKANVKGVKKDLTPLKLQKILYYVQGWYLADYGKPLFEDQILAWKYGPVVRKVYDYYRDHPTGHITPAEVPGNIARLDESTKIFLDTIWDQYGKKTAWELVGMTHITQPWIDAFADPLSDEISPDEIRDYFVSIKP
jgi:uncharacterized phage-associated protein